MPQKIKQITGLQPSLDSKLIGNVGFGQIPYGSLSNPKSLLTSQGLVFEEGNGVLRVGYANSSNNGTIQMGGGTVGSAFGGGFYSNGGTSANANGGSIRLDGGALPGGSLIMADGGGNIRTNESGQIQLGSLPTRTVLNGTATALRNINFPDISGLSLVSNDAASFLNTSSDNTNSFSVPGITGAKLFRISFYASTQVSSSGFLDKVYIGFTDEVGSKTFATPANFLPLTTGNFKSFSIIIRAMSGTAIVISNDTLNIATGKFNLFATLEQIT